MLRSKNKTEAGAWGKVGDMFKHAPLIPVPMPGVCHPLSPDPSPGPTLPLPQGKMPKGMSKGCSIPRNTPIAQDILP